LGPGDKFKFGIKGKRFYRRIFPGRVPKLGKTCGARIKTFGKLVRGGNWKPGGENLSTEWWKPVEKRGFEKRGGRI